MHLALRTAGCEPHQIASGDHAALTTNQASRFPMINAFSKASRIPTTLKPEKCPLPARQYIKRAPLERSFRPGRLNLNVAELPAVHALFAFSL